MLCILLQPGALIANNYIRNNYLLAFTASVLPAAVSGCPVPALLHSGLSAATGCPVSDLLHLGLSSGSARPVPALPHSDPVSESALPVPLLPQMQQ